MKEHRKKSKQSWREGKKTRKTGNIQTLMTNAGNTNAQKELRRG
jgi:hypothetical protein